MEDPLAQERLAEQHVLTLLNTRDVPADQVLPAFHQYLQIAHAAVFLDFQDVEASEGRIWNVHTQCKRYFSRKLKKVRAVEAERPVEVRHVTKSYLEFLKTGERFWRLYLNAIDQRSGGLPELREFVGRLKVEGSGESQPISIPPELHSTAVAACLRSLIYLGDLSRYRATESLDTKPDIGRALGYYELASAVVPSSGLGHHQQAVVALSRSDHPRVLYHFYRSITVKDKHANGMANLRLEFGKINAAWDKGELIPKGAPNDPDVPKRVLTGWFVRLHSLCFKGDAFRGYEELEREVLSQLANLIKQRPLDDMLDRMILTNIAAQHVAGDYFQDHPSQQSQDIFIHYFRFNLKTFTVLLRVFYDDLRNLLLNIDDQNVELSAKLTDLGCRLLPCLRIYNNWLKTMAHFVQGVGEGVDFMRESVQTFWPLYARAIDLVAQAFPIWDLEDVEDVYYMLEEDVNTFDFVPLTKDNPRQPWFIKETGQRKLRYSDMAVVRVSRDEEMLHRVKDFLADGLYLAHDDEDAPIKLIGTRIVYGDESNMDALVVKPVEYKPAPTAPPKAQGKPKPVSYAMAAAKATTRPARPAPVQRNASSNKTQSRDAQLSRMVDDLVDDDDGNNPVTPPQQHASNPAVVTNGEPPLDAMQGLELSKAPAMKQVAGRPNVTVTPPPNRPVGHIARPMSGNHDRMQSVSKLWDNGQAPNSSFPIGLPAGTGLGSPATATRHGHSRVNSASSIRSRGSLNGVDPWASDSAPRNMPDSIVPHTVYGNYSSIDQAGMGSPLLFGAGGGPWSTTSGGLPRGYRNASPPNGQGG